MAEIAHHVSLNDLVSKHSQVRKRNNPDPVIACYLIALITLSLSFTHFTDKL